MRPVVNERLAEYRAEQARISRIIVVVFFTWCIGLSVIIKLIFDRLT